jgi:hypothetical protein
MINIIKDRYNHVYVTVTELTTISPPYYLMTLQSNDTEEIKILRLGTNESPNLERYDFFIIEETPNEDLDNGKITLIPGGTYDYTIYQTHMDVGNTPNLLAVHNICERGLLSVSGGLNTNSTYNNINPITVFE